MRKPVVLTLLGAVLVLSGVFYLGVAPGNKSPAKPAATGQQVSPAAPDSVALPANSVSQDAPSNSLSLVQQAKPRITRPTQEDAASVKTEQLMELAASNDPSALQAIVAELNNGNPDIRKSAVDATVQLGDTNAIPWLEAAAQWTQSADERTEILEAVDFLKLPKLENRTEGKRVARPKTVSNTVKTPKLSP